MKPLNMKQTKFGELYAASMDVRESWIGAGYSEKSASSGAYTLLNSPAMQAYLQDMHNQLAIESEGRIANASEIMEFLSDTMRGISSRDSDIGDQVSMGERLKAAELMGKKLGLFTEKKQSEVFGEIKINIDYGED